ncbi:unnamed protein product [Prunus armeniaca]
MDSVTRSIVIGTLVEIMTACSVSVIVIGEVDSGASEVISTSPTGRAKSVGCANLMAWCSGPRGCALTCDVLLLDLVRGRASTVYRASRW